MSIVIKGATVVSTHGQRQLDVRIVDEKVTELGVNLATTADTVVDATGCYLFPGFIDAHTHMELNNGPGTASTADNFTTGSLAAVAKGTTSVLDMATPDRGHSLQDCLTTWNSLAAGKSSCDYSYHMSIIEWNQQLAAEVPKMAAQGITSFKMYMAYDNLRTSDAEIYAAMCEIKKVHGMLGIHCENGDLVNTLQTEYLAKGLTAPKYHPMTRPNMVEAEAINRYLTIAALVGLPVNIVHLSTRESLAVVRAARARGQQVYVETCPQYLLLDDHYYDLPDFEGAKYICSPPLRSTADEAALWQALEQGEINTISTDHCDFNFHDQKFIGKDDFTKIPGGMPGVETRPELIYTAGVATGKISLEQFVGLLSENIARQFGMYPQKGVIQIGSDADLVIWDPQQQGVISAATQLQNVDYTAYEGFKTQGAARAVYLRGQQVAANGKVLAGQQGKFVFRHGSDYNLK